MKKKGFLLILPLIFILFATSVKGGDNTIERWILIVGGFDPDLHGLFDTYYCYYVMRDFGINPDTNIQYLYEDPSWELEYGIINNETTKQNVQWSIQNWLFTHSDEDDIVFIYFRCHGGGFNGTSFNATTGNPMLDSGRIDENGDEGNEHQYPNGTWFGVDECLWLYGDGTNKQFYWDDELAEDLDTLTYGKLIMLFQSCKSVDASCFSGGFIDDLSAPNRIIITSSNETWYSHGDITHLGEPHGDGLSEFSAGFFDALYGYETEVDLTHLTTLWDKPVNADYDGNMHVSIEEAFRYAYENDYARWVVGHYIDDEGNHVDESPWIDCDGDGLPTFKEGQDFLDYSQNSRTFLDWIPGDTNCDGIVDAKDSGLLGLAWGSEKGDPNYNPYCDFNGDGLINGHDSATLGLHWGEQLG